MATPMLTVVYRAMLSVKLCIHTLRFWGRIWKQGGQIGRRADDEFVFGDDRGPQSSGPEAGADAVKVLSVFIGLGRSIRQGKEHEVLKLPPGNGAEQRGAPVLNR